MKFEDLLDVYFQSEQSPNEKLPTVKYFADKVNLSSNYFGDLIKKETGKTAQEYIQGKIINIAKEKMQSKKRICKCLLPNSIYRFLFILFLQNEHVLYFSNAFINSFFTVSTPGKPVCF